jgi:hypothetical protein
MPAKPPYKTRLLNAQVHELYVVEPDVPSDDPAGCLRAVADLLDRIGAEEGTAPGLVMLSVQDTPGEGYSATAAVARMPPGVRRPLPTRSGT